LKEISESRKLAKSDRKIRLSSRSISSQPRLTIFDAVAYRRIGGEQLRQNRF
jgi:hypothetical protein